MRLVIKELFFFSIVGTVGFLVDTGVLYLLKADLGNYWARAVSFPCAVFVTWLLNRYFTFKSKISNEIWYKEFIRYFVMMFAGGLVNYAVYVFCIANYILVQNYPVLGVAAGSICGLFVNYLQLKLLLYKYKI